MNKHNIGDITRKNLLKKIIFPDLGDEPMSGIDILLSLLETLLLEQYGFSGKRPFGNSDWYCYVNRIFSGLNTTDEDNDYTSDDGFESHGFGGNEKYNKSVSETISYIKKCVLNYRKKDIEYREKDLESRIKRIKEICEF